MLDEKLIMELRNYVNKYLNRRISFYKPMVSEEIKSSECLEPSIRHSELDDFINKTRKPTFNQVLFRFIDKRGTSDSDIYKKAGLDRRHFSKIRSNPDYRPGKNSAIALALALELNKQETSDLLNAAGYSLSESNKFDLVIRFCVEKKIYDINAVNQALDYFSLKPLPGALE